MSKREIYEKLVNSRSEGEIKQLIKSSYRGSRIQRKDVAVKREKQNKGFNLYQQKRET